MLVRAQRPIAGDVWAVLAEPYHLPDWWPDYRGVEPDRRGLAVGARWKVAHLRGREGLIVIERVEPPHGFRWLDVRGGYRVAVEAGDQVVLELESSLRRHFSLRSYPRQALGRLQRLCDTEPF